MKCAELTELRGEVNRVAARLEAMSAEVLASRPERPSGSLAGQVASMLREASEEARVSVKSIAQAEAMLEDIIITAQAFAAAEQGGPAS